jgi:hypothetical protein
MLHITLKKVQSITIILTKVFSLSYKLQATMNSSNYAPKTQLIALILGWMTQGLRLQSNTRYYAMQHHYLELKRTNTKLKEKFKRL